MRRDRGCPPAADVAVDADALADVAVLIALGATRAIRAADTSRDVTEKAVDGSTAVRPSCARCNAPAVGAQEREA